MIHELHIEDPDRVPVEWWPQVKALKDRRLFEFGPGLTILWGPNGSGKSTLLKMLARLTHCEQGGVPLVTRESLRTLLRSGFGPDAEVRDGARIVGDGKPVHFLDPAAEPGLIGGAFDDDFFRDGLESTLLRRRSSGEQVTLKMNRILESSAKLREVEWRVPQRPDDETQRRCTAALRPTSEEEGPPTMLLDEPDRSIGIPRQMELWDLLARQQRFQVVAATHSPFALAIEGVTYIDIEKGYLAKCLACTGVVGHRLDVMIGSRRPRPRTQETEPQPDESTSIVVQGVQVPLPGAVGDFCSPDWQTVADFYGEWAARVAETQSPWDPQPYLLAVAKELERLEARPGRSADEWFKRMLEHFGLGWLDQQIAAMKRSRAARLGDAT